MEHQVGSFQIELYPRDHLPPSHLGSQPLPDVPGKLHSPLGSHISQASDAGEG